MDLRFIVCSPTTKLTGGAKERNHDYFRTH